jgi:hypothetical protein
MLDGVYKAKASDATELTVTVAVGGGCMEDGTATVDAVESSDEVELTATVTRENAPEPTRGAVCPANLVVQNVMVQLQSPLSARLVRDAVTGTLLKRQP